MKPKILSKRLVIVTSILLSFLAVLSWFVLKDVYSPGPVFFSLNQKGAKYSIKKYEFTDGSSTNYFVVYKPSVNENTGVNEILVGKSKVELDKYVGKNLKIKGSYTGRVDDIQCIKDNCHKIGSKSLVIDIDSLDVLGK